MITYYFILKENTLQYIKVTAQNQAVATDVFLFLHPKGFANISEKQPKYAQLYEQINQRQTTEF